MGKRFKIVEIEGYKVFEIHSEEKFMSDDINTINNEFVVNKFIFYKRINRRMSQYLKRR